MRLRFEEHYRRRIRGLTVTVSPSGSYAVSVVLRSGLLLET